MDATELFANEIGKTAAYGSKVSAPPPSATVRAIVKILKAILLKKRKHSVSKEVGEAVATAISKKRKKGKE